MAEVKREDEQKPQVEHKLRDANASYIRHKVKGELLLEEEHAKMSLGKYLAKIEIKRDAQNRSALEAVVDLLENGTSEQQRKIMEAFEQQGIPKTRDDNENTLAKAALKGLKHEIPEVRAAFFSYL